MAWPKRTYFTSQTGAIAGRKGGKTWRIGSWPKSGEWRAGYQAGWAAAKRAEKDRRAERSE